MDDVDEDANYTLYSNGTWIISRECGSSRIQVTCENKAAWSENVDCQESTTVLTTLGKMDYI